MKRKKSGNYDGVVRFALCLLMALALGYALRGGVRLASSGRVEVKREKAGRPCVVIDAGHGGSNLRKVTKGK